MCTQILNDFFTFARGNKSDDMKIVTNRAFRAHMNHYLSCAEEETVYITRPGGKLLMISPVPVGDVPFIKAGYGKEPDKLLTEEPKQE